MVIGHESFDNVINGMLCRMLITIHQFARERVEDRVEVGLVLI